MLQIKYDNVGEWLKGSEKYKSHLQIMNKENDFYVSEECYIERIDNLKLSDLILVYNSTIWWNINLPQEFYDYCINNKKSVIECFNRDFLVISF